MNSTMINTVNLYQGLFGQVSLIKVAERIKKLQEAPAIVVGSAGYMGGPILSNIRRRNSKVFPQDRSEELIKDRLHDLQKRDDKAVKSRALHPLQRAKFETNGHTLPPIVFPNEGRIPKLEGTPEEKKAQALRFLEENLDVKIRELYKSSLFVIEAVPEKVEIKQALFEFMAYVLSNEAILATNTSSLSIDEIAKNIPNPERVVGIHYFDPADQNQLAEVIIGSKTSPEVAVTAYYLLQLEGKKPIICFKDSPLATANRIFVGILNHAARLADNGLAPRDLIDEVFLETFYSEQVRIKLKSAKKQFAKVPRLAKFKDEAAIYKQVEEIEKKGKTIELLKQAQGELNQKVLYAEIVENAKVLGEFYETAPSVLEIKALARERLNIINQYLKATHETPELKSRTIEEVTGKKLRPYHIEDKSNDRSKTTKKFIRDHLIGAYVAIAQKILDEGISTTSDIELACTEGFRYNISPFTREVQRSLDLVSDELNQKTSRISHTCIEHTEEELSGVQSYKADDIGYIVIGRNHIQNLRMTSNSLNPSLLQAIYNALLRFKDDPTVNVIFIESKGGKTFGSGADLAYVQEIINDATTLSDFLDLGNKVMDEIENCPKPTVGIADGTWAGGSGELLSACQYRFGTVDASGCMPENALGLFQAWGGVKRFPKLLGIELTVPFFCNSKGTKFAWMTALELCKAGFYDNKIPILRSELVQFKADLIQGKIKGINIRKPNPRQPEYEKQIDDYEIRRKFNLGKIQKPNKYKHKKSPLTWRVRRLTEKLVRTSNHPEKQEEILVGVKPKELINGIKRVQRWYVNPQLWIAQNTLATKTIEAIGYCVVSLAKLRKPFKV